MADPYKWKGSKVLARGQARWTFEADKIKVAFAYTGPMSECIKAGRTMVGSTVAEFDIYGLKVTIAEAQEGDGESGVLSVSLEAIIAPDDSVSTAPLSEPIYEIEWSELTKAIETHPDCGVLKSSRPRYKDGLKVTDGTGRQRTWDDWPDLDADDYEATGNQWSLLTYKKRKERGQDSYNVGAPEITRTMDYLRDPGGVGAGVFTRQNPPAGGIAAPTGYEWLLTADSLTKEGRRRCRRTRWTGAEKIDHFVYD